MSVHFSTLEQACPCCQAISLAPGFLQAMDDLREAWGKPLRVNSMCRCQKHNSAVGGKVGSYHLITHTWGCCAADISTNGWTGADKWAFIELAMQRGFSIGFNKTFLHVDRRHVHDKGWPKPVFFNY